MSYNCCSGNFSSCSFGSYLRYPGSYASNLVCNTDLCCPSTCQLGSSLYRGGQKTYWEPTRCQTSCYRPRTSMLCSPCHMTCPGSLGFGSSSCRRSLGYGSRSCYSLGHGSSGFRSLKYGGCGFPSLSYGSRFCYPNYLASRAYQSSCYRPICGSRFYQFTC
ncbi:keratin-associated protein 13-4-like [Sapajus apella]|uniref:Keratin-associated protein n=1 Tax=Sapajus apella TaxID=9515 RepID=A0A6J3HR35_SAPAP|nr:keratin-associated protein 13-4-like [Sapajus apella]